MSTQPDGAFTLDPARTALVLLDYQNYNVHPDGYWASVTPGLLERVAPALQRTSAALAAARAAGIRVVHVQNAWREGHPDVNPHTPWQAQAKAAGRSTEGSWGIEFFEPLTPLDDELVVRKRAVSGFVGTELDRLLLLHDVSTVVIAGIITNFAAEGTARDASDRGYRVVVLGDCCESVTDEMHAFAVTQILPIVGEVVGVEEFAQALGKPLPHRPEQRSTPLPRAGQQFARVTRWPHLEPDAVDDFRQNTVPVAREMEGIEEMLLLVDEATGTAITITFWASEESMRKSEDAAAQLRDQDVEQGLASESPVVERYRVAVRSPGLS